MTGRSGYALIVALGIALVLSAIALALVTSQSSLSSNIAIARRDLEQAILLHQAREGLAIKLDSRSRIRDGTNLVRDFSLTEGGTTLRVNWKEKTGSLLRGRLNGYADPKNFLTPEGLLPEASYHERALKEALGGLKVPPAHTATGFQFPSNLTYTTVFSNAFPYAVCAPGGEVHLKSLSGFSNHTYNQGDKVSASTAYPAWAMAAGSVSIKDFPVGKAFSAVGPIDVEGGALGVRSSSSSNGFDARISRPIEEVRTVISKDTLDKTPALVGHVLKPQGLIDFLRGRTSFLSLASAQQGLMMPFFPIPSHQGQKIYLVILLHHPWPQDLERPDNSELSKKLKVLLESYADVSQRHEKEVKLAQEYWDKIQANPESPGVPKWEKAALEARKRSLDLGRRQSDLMGQINKLRQEIENGSRFGLRGKAPRTTQEEKVHPTWGWSYFYIPEQIFEIIGRLWDDDWDLIWDHLTTPTRLYHFGGRDPEWYFPDGLPRMSDGHEIKRPGYVPKGWLSLKGTMTVPKGRTLRITEDLQVRGDLWLQKGSTFYVKGDLEVRAPVLFHDSNGKPIPSNDLTFPNGRLIVEEGANLIVDGNLSCQGGTRDQGSVWLAGPMDRVHPISSSIMCQGDFKSRFGIHPALNLEDLMGYAARQNKAYEASRNALFHLSWYLPSLSRIAGPFDSRKCWFAENATTITLIWAKKAYIPVPTPMPHLKNCLRPVFDSLSWFTALKLNLRLGPYFYPQSEYWLLSRGSVPVMLKIHPNELQKLIDPLSNLPPIDMNEVAKIFKDALVKMVYHSVTEVVQKLVGEGLTIILKKSPIPYLPVKCVVFDTKKPAQPVKDFVKKLVKIQLKMVQGIVVKLLNQVRDSAQRHYGGRSRVGTRELPGVLLYAGGDIEVGESVSDSVLASGFFVARGDIRFRTARTVGAAISIRGDVIAEEFLYYPYFSSASLYNGLKPYQYLAGQSLSQSFFPADELRDMLNFGIPSNPTGNRDLTLTGGRPIFQGWSR